MKKYDVEIMTKHRDEFTMNIDAENYEEAKEYATDGMLNNQFIKGENKDGNFTILSLSEVAYLTVKNNKD